MYRIYSKDNCKFCTMSKQLLEQKGILYEELKYETDFTRDELFERFPQAKTFPQIETTDGVYVGGFDQLKELIG